MFDDDNVYKFSIGYGNWSARQFKRWNVPSNVYIVSSLCIVHAVRTLVTIGYGEDSLYTGFDDVALDFWRLYKMLVVVVWGAKVPE